MEQRLITLAGSSKFYGEIEELYNLLNSHGITCYTPSFENNETRVSVDKEKKAELTHRFFDKIKNSDAMYLTCPNGYVGTSGTLEVGFAYALGKKIFASEAPTEFAIAALVEKIISPADFLAFVKENLQP